MKALALLQRPERAIRRGERTARTPFVPPEPASKALDAIDEQIATLLDGVSSKHKAQSAVASPNVRLVGPREGVSTTPLPNRWSEAVTPYAVKTAFAIVLYSIAVGFLIVYLMSALGRPLG